MPVVMHNAIVSSGLLRLPVDAGLATPTAGWSPTGVAGPACSRPRPAPASAPCVWAAHMGQRVSWGAWLPGDALNLLWAEMGF